MNLCENLCVLCGKKYFDRGYKNNNGNSSLGSVPIHRLQPRLLTMPDYCYFDRSHHWVRDSFLQPMTFGSCLLQHNLPVVLSPACAGFRDEVSFRRCRRFPEGNCISFRKPGAEALHLVKPCDSISEKNVSGFRRLTEHTEREVL